MFRAAAPTAPLALTRMPRWTSLHCHQAGLARARMSMDKHDLGPLVCFVRDNVRHITSVYEGN